MRFETHRVSEYIVEKLKRAAPVREILVDGGDIVEFRLISDDRVRLYLIENALSLHEIKGIVEPNSAEGVCTLFLLWRDMLLPPHGYRCRLQDWSAALLTLYGNRIYAYDIDGPDIYLFPVFFDGQGYERVARFGLTLDFATLGCGIVPPSSTYFDRDILVAGFAPWGGQPVRAASVPAGLAADYALLGVEPGATRAAVKRAYRRLALRHHPDLNPDPRALQRMQQINQAYERILEALRE